MSFCRSWSAQLSICSIGWTCRHDSMQTLPPTTIQADNENIASALVGYLLRQLGKWESLVALAVESPDTSESTRIRRLPLTACSDITLLAKIATAPIIATILDNCYGKQRHPRNHSRLSQYTRSH